MPGIVLTAEIASAPASTTAFAITLMSGTLGASLAAIFASVFFLTTDMTAAASSLSRANGMPKSSAVLGHDKLTSIIFGLSVDNFLATSPNSSFVPPNRLGMTGTPAFLMAKSSSPRLLSTPELGRPTAFRKPPSNSVSTGLLWPSRSAGPIDLGTIAPAPFLAAYTHAAPEIPTSPEANMVGFSSFTPHKSTFIYFPSPEIAASTEPLNILLSSNDTPTIKNKLKSCTLYKVNYSAARFPCL